jgi:short-subunit dehydrogenase
MSRQTILVTGASSGIGALCASRLAASGHRVIAASRRGTAPDGCTALVMDVDRDDSVAAAVARVLAGEGRIDAAVLCAGWGLTGAIEDTSADEAIAQFQTNFFGVHRVVRSLLPSMRAQGSGRLIIVSSLVASMPIPYQSMYSASKAALSNYAEALRLELTPFAIRVTNIEPGNFRTGFGGARRAAAGSTVASPHAARAKASVEWMEKDEQNAPPPDLVAARVEKYLRDENPPGRVLIAANAVERFAPLLRGLLPARLYEAIALRLFRVL